MSIINKMLSDLEKTRAKNQPTPEETLSSVYLSTQKHKTHLAIKLVSLVLLLTIVISAYIYYRPKLTIPKIATNSLKKKAPPPLAATTKKVVANIEPTIKLKDIKLQTANDRTIIDFILNAPTLYYIEHSADNQQLFVTLSNTGLLGNLPVDLNNSLLTALNTKQSGTSTICTLTLLPGTKVDELQLLDKPQPLLHLVLANPQLTISRMLKSPIPVSPDQQEQQRYQEIQQLIAQDKLEEATTQLQLFVGDFPNNLVAREILAALLIKEGALTKATKILTIGLNKFPNHAPFIKLEAHILAEQGKTAAAINLLQKFSTDSGEDPDYLALLALLYQQHGQFIQAAELYNQLTKLQPQKAAWWVGLGIALESAGKKNTAKIAYNKAYTSLETTPELMAFLTDKIKK